MVKRQVLKLTKVMIITDRVTNTPNETLHLINKQLYLYLMAINILSAIKFSLNKNFRFSYNIELKFQIIIYCINKFSNKY